jgi:hypothetical protein
MSDEDQQVEVTTPAGSLRVRGTDLMSLVTIIFIVAMAAFIYSHVSDAESREKQSKAQNQQFITVLQDLSASQKDASKQQRLLTCIVSRPEVERKREFEAPNSFCQQMAKP